ncbi:hypothetical protein [Streptomyces sp. NPDC018693]|uniref:hypothetical protein n=1 Tax=unclassified Streptomyces TaxID=2593676 RepID=UPI00378C4210
MTTSVPAKQCTPAAHQTLTMRSPDVLQWRSGAATASFRRVKAAPEVVPAELVGHWKQAPNPELPADQQDLWSFRITISQGPIGASLVHIAESYPKTDEETGEETGDTVNCASTAVVGGAGNLLIIGPPEPDTAAGAWGPGCNKWDSSQSLRVERFNGEDRLLMYGMIAEGEPGEYVKTD